MENSRFPKNWVQLAPRRSVGVADMSSERREVGREKRGF
jgi:hypothetical protein